MRKMLISVRNVDNFRHKSLKIYKNFGSVAKSHYLCVRFGKGFGLPGE